MDGTVTIYDVAREAGCSTATVSLSLRDSDKVKQSTKDYVIEVAKQLGYKPNLIARGLSMKSSFTLGMLLPNMENPSFSMIVSGVENYVNTKGYGMIIGGSNQSLEKENFYLDMLEQKQVDGMFILPTYYDNVLCRLTERPETDRIPFVLTGAGSKRTDINFVKCDSRMGAYMAVEYLIKSGRRRIGFMSSTPTPWQYSGRFVGYQDALAVHGVEYDERLVRVCGAGHENIYRATVDLLENEKVDAVFCLYDFMAIPVVRAIMHKGYRIPDDIAVIGYDNIDISGYLPISLSTVETFSEKVGRLAAEILIKKIENPETEVRQIVIKPELVLRESTGS